VPACSSPSPDLDPCEHLWSGILSWLPNLLPKNKERCCVCVRSDMRYLKKITFSKSVVVKINYLDWTNIWGSFRRVLWQKLRLWWFPKRLRIAGKCMSRGSAPMQHDMRPLCLLHEYSIKTADKMHSEFIMMVLCSSLYSGATTSWHASHRLVLQTVALQPQLFDCSLYTPELWSRRAINGVQVAHFDFFSTVLKSRP
jgi:hypothetical protein